VPLRKLGTAEPARIEVEDAPDELTKTAKREWTEDDERELAQENEGDQ